MPVIQTFYGVNVFKNNVLFSNIQLYNGNIYLLHWVFSTRRNDKSRDTYKNIRKQRKDDDERMISYEEK